MCKLAKICRKNVPKWLFFFLILVLALPGKIWAEEDEFQTFSNDTAKIQEQGEDDEFETFDESGSFEQTENSDACSACTGDQECCSKNKSGKLDWVLGILAFTVLAGFFVRFPKTRNLRGFFLIASVIILGFIKGACPCPISSMQNLVLFGFGVDVPWQSLIWFLALIPITYLFGRVYCGWICHLGAFQELIYLPAKIKVLQGEKAQKIMRAVRIFFLIALIVQLAVTKTNLFKHYDPFKAAYNLLATNTISWVLLGLLLVSSVFIYRPFCKTVCPVGLILGWINKIPGASVIGNNGNCSGCKTCESNCKIRAITRDANFSKLDNQECIACGECISHCNKNALHFFRNNKNTHHDKIICNRLDL